MSAVKAGVLGEDVLLGTDGMSYVATTEATVRMPDWFQTLNRDFQYQLTPIGQFAQAMLSRDIENNRFTIKAVKPNVKGSWQATDIRHALCANAHRTAPHHISVEQAKPENEKGSIFIRRSIGNPSRWTSITTNIYNKDRLHTRSCIRCANKTNAASSWFIYLEHIIIEDAPLQVASMMPCP